MKHATWFAPAPRGSEGRRNTISNFNDCYEAFIPNRFCDIQISTLISSLSSVEENAVWVEDDGVRFLVKDGTTCSPTIIKSDMYSVLDSVPKWFHELIGKMISENKISLQFICYYDSQPCYEEFDQNHLPVGDWENALRDCPTLILREILAQRIESERQSEGAG